MRYFRRASRRVFGLKCATSGVADCQWPLCLPWDMAWARAWRRRAICAGAQARQQHRARSAEGSAGAGAVAGAGGARREAARNITDAWA